MEMTALKISYKMVIHEYGGIFTLALIRYSMIVVVILDLKCRRFLVRTISF